MPKVFIAPSFSDKCLNHRERAVLYMKLLAADGDFMPTGSSGHADWILHFETPQYVTRVTGCPTGIQSCISTIPVHTYVPRTLIDRPDLPEMLTAMYKNKWQIRYLF